ncbi:MAG: phospholipase D-like domain-containing protein [Polyangia bacterium]
MPRWRPAAFCRPSDVAPTAVMRVGALAVGLACACGLTPPASPAEAALDPARGVTVMVLPDQDATPILEAIRSARRRIWMEMYLLTASEAVAALVQAHAAGVEVRVLLEPAPYGDEAANQAAFAVMSANGMDVRWTHRAVGLVHAKLMLIDGTTAWVMTLNLTASGLRGNREYVVVDHDPTEVRRVEAIWSADAIGAESAPGGEGATGARGRTLLVSPLNARARLGGCISAARTSIVVEVEEVSDGDLVARLLSASGDGVLVTVVAPATNRSLATTAALKKLAAGGVTVRVLLTPTVHGKAMVVDGRQVYLGSMNLTRASLDDNREVGLLWSDSTVATRVSSVIARDARAGLVLGE